jgi:ATP-dependent RNA helicase RhlE
LLFAIFKEHFVTFQHFSFDPRINAGIEEMGYEEPTPIQQQAIPVVMEGRDVLGIAQTGTGKTAAFMLPILQRLTRGKLRQVRALVVAPTASWRNKRTSSPKPWVAAPKFAV